MNTEDVANVLLDANALIVRPKEPFIFSSGMHSPVYTDNRLLISLPIQREFISHALANKAREISADIIAGVATAGIPWAAWVAQKLNKPMVFVRSEAKAHGRGNQIEGMINPGQSVVIIEDLVSTGKSTLSAVKALKEAGANVLGAIAIITYGFPICKNSFEQEKVPLLTLTDFSTCLDVAMAKGILSNDECSLAKSWMNDPAGWKP